MRKQTKAEKQEAITWLKEMFADLNAKGAP